MTGICGETCKRNKQRSKKMRGSMIRRKKENIIKAKIKKEYIGMMNGVKHEINTRCNRRSEKYAFH